MSMDMRTFPRPFFYFIPWISVSSFLFLFLFFFPFPSLPSVHAFSAQLLSEIICKRLGMDGGYLIGVGLDIFDEKKRNLCFLDCIIQPSRNGVGRKRLHFRL